MLVVTTDALVFYASSTIQDYLGFQQVNIYSQVIKKNCTFYVSYTLGTQLIIAIYKIPKYVL